MAQDGNTGRRIVLRRYSEGALRADDFAAEDAPALEAAEGEFVVRNVFVSVDPMLRLFTDRAPLRGSLPALPLGTTIPGAAVGEVVTSRNTSFKIGDIVEGRFGWQHFSKSNGLGVQRVKPALGKIENALGIGGLPGFTAFVGLQAAGGVRTGQTWLVSGAAGAVGSAAGALIRARGGRAVGIAGGAAKRRYLLENIGYAEVADRLAPDFESQLAQALPKGVDVYFDNVGGPLLASIMPVMARGGLVLISGLMAQYQGDDTASKTDNLPAVLRAVMGKGVRIQGFSQFGQEAQRPAFEEEIGKLLAGGQFIPEVHIEEGLERLPIALINLFEKSVTGKVVVRIAPDPG